MGARLPQSAAGTSMADELTVCIKHTSRFARRREMLGLLLLSVRQRLGAAPRILVADDGGAADHASLRRAGAELIRLPAAAGLSFGRNELVAATRTPYLAMLDDDVLLHEASRLDVLLARLKANPSAALAAGCYYDLRFGSEDCFNLRFDAEEGGAVVRALPLQPAPSTGCTRVHAAHNFFVARTETLRRFGWDPRQKVREHETFFLTLTPTLTLT